MSSAWFSIVCISPNCFSDVSRFRLRSQPDCSARPLRASLAPSERDLSRYGLAVSAEPPADAMVPKVVRASDGTRRLVLSPVGIDPGFGVNVGKVGLMLPEI
jgi:hypothetical protein